MCFYCVLLCDFVTATMCMCVYVCVGRFVFYRLFLSGRYWFTVLLTCGICAVLDLAWAAVHKRVLPSKLDIWMEHEQLFQQQQAREKAQQQGAVVTAPAVSVPDSFAVSHRQILAQQIHLIVCLPSRSFLWVLHSMT